MENRGCQNSQRPERLKVASKLRDGDVNSPLANEKSPGAGAPGLFIRAMPTSDQ